jgi:hypothetical protein
MTLSICKLNVTDYSSRTTLNPRNEFLPEALSAGALLRIAFLKKYGSSFPDPPRIVRMSHSPSTQALPSVGAP